MTLRRHARVVGRFAAGLAVSAVFIWLALRDKDMGEMWLALKAANYAYLVPYVAILLVIHLIRTVRWGILLEPVAKIPFRRLNRASAVGLMALVVLPFRLGEFARPFLVSDRAPGGERGVRMSAATGSIVVERIVDGITTATLLLTTLFLTVPSSDDPHLARVRFGGYVLMAIFVGGLVAIGLLLWQRERMLGLVETLLRPLSPRLADRVSGLLDSFIGGLRLVPHRGKLVLFLLLTFAYWGINGFGMLVLAWGFGLELTLLQMYTVLGALVIGVMIPAGPGMLGTFQFFCLMGLGLFVPAAVLDGAGVAYANVLWLAQFGQQVILGLVFLLLGHVTFSRLVETPGEGAEAPPAAGHGAEAPAEVAAGTRTAGGA